MFPTTLRWVPVLLAVGSFTLGDEPQPAPPKLTINLRKKTDTLHIRRSAQQTVYVIKSPSGIGGGSIIRTEGDWPRRVVLRFQYDDERSFEMLESFSLRTDRLETGCSISRIPDKEEQKPLPMKLKFWFISRSGDPKYQHTGGIPPAGTLDATVHLKTTGLEIALPSDCLMDSKTLTLDWIDAYRT